MSLEDYMNDTIMMMMTMNATTPTITPTSPEQLFQNALRILESIHINVRDTILCAQSYDVADQFQLPLCSTNIHTNMDDSMYSMYHNQRFLLMEESNSHIDSVNNDNVIDSSIVDSSVVATITNTNTAEHDIFLFYNIFGSFFCIACIALIAGLYLGLLTLDALDLEIIQRVSIDDDEIMYATNLLPIVKQRHRLLVTLLILNTVTMETLPVFLNNVVPNWVAILLSTTLILIFGEIIPSAIFTGPNQLYLGNMLAPLTKFFMWLLTPFAVPLGALLDYLVHGYVPDPKHPHTEPAYNRNELSALVRIQHESRMAAANRNRQSVTIVKNQQEFKEKKKDESWNAIKKEIMERVNERWEISSERNHSHHHHHHRSSHEMSSLEIDEEPPEPAVEQLNPPLHATEVDLITGALQMKTRLVMDEYTPLRKVYALPDTTILSLHTVAGIYAKGYSRIPVYEASENDPDDRTAILGFLMIRQLILIDWDDERALSTLPLQRPDCVSPRMNLVDALELLRTGGTLMAFVCARPEIANRALENEQPLPVEAGFMGIITLEDVVESILQGRIHDEWDVKDRDRAIATLHRWAATKLQAFIRHKRSVKLAKQLRVSTTTPTSTGNISLTPTNSLSPTKEELMYHSNHSVTSDNKTINRFSKWYNTFSYKNGNNLKNNNIENDDDIDDVIVGDEDEEKGYLLKQEQQSYLPASTATPLLQTVGTRQGFTLYS